MNLEDIKAMERAILEAGNDEALPQYLRALCEFRALCLAMELRQRCRSFAITQARLAAITGVVGSSRVDLQACKLEYSIVSPK